MPTRLRNQNCPYCGTQLSDSETTNEHVIGRRFVPRGTLNQNWNLILRACRHCNNRKSDLEDDLSAITMQPNAWGQHPRDHVVVRSDAQRKAARSLSRRTHKTVKESNESIGVQAQFAPGVQMTLTLTSPAQVDETRVFELARFQLSGFFYLLTYQQNNAVGGFWPGGFFPLNQADRGDWGNVLHSDFMNRVIAWPIRLVLVTAQGFFRAAIRRSPDAACWSWALEWNEHLRAIGLFGEEAAARTFANSLSAPPMSPFISQPDGSRIRFRPEVPLPMDDDVLFHEALPQHSDTPIAT